MAGTHAAAYPLTPPARYPTAAGGAAHPRLSSLARLLRFAAVMALLLAGAAFPQSSFFTVSDITVLGARHVPVTELLARSGLQRGQPLSSVDAQAVAARLAQHPWVAAVHVRISPVGRVDLLVAERVPHAALPYRNGYLLLDHTGVAIEFTATAPSLPIVAVDGVALPWVRLGDRLPADGVIGALRVLALMPQEEIARGLQVRVDRAGAVRITTADRITVLMGQPRGLGNRAASLPQVLAAIRRQHLTGQYVDLRFAGSVILRPRPATGSGGVRP